MENASLLSFAEAAAVFEKMYPVRNAGIEAEVKITEVRFGYARITEQNQNGSGLMAPVWDFFGVITGANGDVIDDPEESLLTVNAMDGSVIDRNLGY